MAGTGKGRGSEDDRSTQAPFSSDVNRNQFVAGYGSSNAFLRTTGRGQRHHVTVVILVIAAVLSVVGGSIAWFVTLGGTHEATRVHERATLPPKQPGSQPAGGTVSAAPSPPPAAFSTPSTPGIVIDQATAEKIFSAEWPVRATALSLGNQAMLARVEQGSALLGDVAWIDCGCASPVAMPANPPHSFTATQQSAYPASFLAEVQTTTTQGPALSDLVFQRASATAPWLIVFTTTYGWAGGSIIAPTTPSSFSTPAPQSGFTTDPQQFPADLAAYWRSWEYTGAPPPSTPFTTAGFLLEHGIADSKTQATWHALGDSETIHFTSSAPFDKRYDFASIMGGNLLCSSISWSSVIRAMSPGARVTQPQDRSALAPEVPPGQYRLVKQQGLRESCFLILPAGTPDVLGEWGGFTSASTSAN